MYGEGKKYPRVCVSAAIVNPEGRVLVTRRSEKVWYPGTWCIPGGHVDGGEDWISALRKEVMEEVGLTIRNEVLIGIYSDPAKGMLPDPVTGEKRYFVSAAFLVKDFTGTPRLTEEISEIAWFYPNELPSNMLSPEDQKILDAFAYKSMPFVR